MNNNKIVVLEAVLKDCQTQPIPIKIPNNLTHILECKIAKNTSPIAIEKNVPWRVTDKTLPDQKSITCLVIKLIDCEVYKFKIPCAKFPIDNNIISKIILSSIPLTNTFPT